MSHQVILLELDLTNATAGRVHRLCTAMHNVFYDGYEYDAVGDLLQIENVETTAEIANIGTTVTLSGIDPAYRNEIDDNGFREAPIKLHLGILPDNDNVLTNVTTFHAGTCSTPITDVDYETGEMTIGVATNSIWGDLDKTPDLNRASFASHSAIHCYDASGNYVPDEAFKFVASTSIEEQWIS